MSVFFYPPMAYYENLFSRTIRETWDYFKGNYQVIYIAKNNTLLGYGTIVRGGGRYRFCTSNDVILCNLWIQPEHRGKGLGYILVQGLLKCIDFSYENVYEFIQHDNVASINVALKNGFVKVFNAQCKGIFRNIIHDDNGSMGIYKLSKSSI